jgi:Protein of unknown function (DUF2950)
MRRQKLNSKASGLFYPFNVAVLTFLLTGCFAARCAAQQKGQQTFPSPQEAAQALATAAQSKDTSAMLSILGPDGEQIVSSGDPIEDAENHANFARKYQQMHRIVKEPDGTAVLYIGAENWPGPIPLVHKGNLWYFDTAAGEAEIVYRRVGRNELSTIRVCQELAAAQREYFSAYNAYAPQIYSDKGQRNGLYWKAAGSEPQSPIGPLVAAAAAEGYLEGEASPPTPYRGYLYHVLTRQGKNAPGGARNYIVNGKMTQGFAFVAYPAEYRSSGVMTFVVSSDGVVYQKDLGKKTESLGKAMKGYNIDSSWQKAEEPQGK